MNVLSLFDGISCGQVALDRAGIKVDKYYASEIDKHAIEVTKKNYPNTIHLGNVYNIDYDNLPHIDMVIGGSPCTYWSIAKKDREVTSEGIGFELFMQYVKAVRTCKPKYFLYENNNSIHKDIKDAISKELGVQLNLLNSSLVSAQQRKRCYWTNIPNVVQPQDKRISLKNILIEDNFSKSDLLHSQNALDYMNKKVKDGRTHWDFKHHSDINDEKSATVVANFFKGVPYNVLIDSNHIRKFHPVECERLQTLPDNYTEGISSTQRYKCIGNGWTIDIIAHIFKNIKNAKY